MARGSIVKRCPICRKLKGPTPGHICIGPDISYYIVYRSNGKQKWEIGGRTKKEAERLLAQKLTEVNNGTYREQKKLYFGAFAQTWLEDCPRSRVKESTFRGYRSDITCHLNPTFSHLLLREIKQEEVQRFLSKLKDTLDPKTVNNIRLTLYMILDYARKLRYIPENPVMDVKPFKVEHKEMDFLDPSEIRLLLKHASEPHRTLLFTAILTGMRRGEILALQWGDIDWNSNTVFVRRSIYWSTVKGLQDGQKRWSFISPKSKRSTRAIVLSPMLKETLEMHRITAPVNQYDLVFANSEGNPLDPDNMIKRDFQATLRFAGLRQIRFHDLRHSYASLLIAQGENIKFIQSQLGHASVQTTLDRYGHLLPVDHVAVGSRVDLQVFGESNKNLTKQAQSITKANNYEQVSEVFLVDSK